MTYETFKSSIVEHLHQDIPDPKKIAIYPVEKNNSCRLDGLTIMERELNISPTIYLNYYYEEYMAGASFQTVYDKMLQTYQLYKPDDSVNISFFTDFENVEPRLVYKLINYDRNLELLAQIPHIRFLDLAIVFYYLVRTSEHGCATILLYHHHLALWNLSLDRLYEAASKNTPILLPIEKTPISEIVEYMHVEKPDHPFFSMEYPDPLPDMYVVSNHYHLYGACCILYPNALKELACRMNADLCILPSSVHETIVLPCSPDYSMEEFSRIVKEVNETEVARPELLSDHAYYYHRSDNQISIS